MPVVLLLVAAYALGTLPTAAVVGRRSGIDPTVAGSGNPGASNVYRTAGRSAGAAVLAGDLLKGALAAGAGVVAGGRGLGLACGAAAVLGHVVPVTRLRHGGKGVATAMGAALVVAPLHALAAVVVWGAVAAAARRASLASLVAVVAVPLMALLSGEPGGIVAGLAAVAAVVVARHAGNIRRLVQGDEPPLRASRR